MAMYLPSKNDDFVDSIETRLLDQYLLRHEPQSEHVRSSRDAISPCIWKPCFPDYQPCHAYAISECQTFSNKSIDKNHDLDFRIPNDSIWSCRDSYPYRVISTDRNSPGGLSHRYEHVSEKKTSSCGRSCSLDRSNNGKLRTDRESERNFGGVCKVKILQNTSRTVDFGCAVYRRSIHSPCLQLDGLRYERSLASSDSLGTYYDSGVLTNRLSPYSPLCAVPLPDSLLLEPGYIHRRNERERDRVRSLNEGYDRLKERLPLRNKDKRISKVDTLRIAIRYIRQLRSILRDAGVSEKGKPKLSSAQDVQEFDESSSECHCRCGSSGIGETNASDGDNSSGH